MKLAGAAGAVGLVLLLAACGNNNGRDVGKINVDWTGNDIAIEAVRVDDAPYNTLHLADAARPILKGEEAVWLRQVSEKTGRSRSARSNRASSSDTGAPLSLAERECLDALKAWRAEVAREHNLPAFVIFHDATLRAIAERQPRTEADLDGISGIGQKKREAYGKDVLRVVSAFG